MVGRRGRGESGARARWRRAERREARVAPRGARLGQDAQATPALAGVALIVAAWKPRRDPPGKRSCWRTPRRQTPLGARGSPRAACVQVAGRSESWDSDARDAVASGAWGDGASSWVLGGSSGVPRGEARTSGGGSRGCRGLREPGALGSLSGAQRGRCLEPLTFPTFVTPGDHDMAGPRSSSRELVVKSVPAMSTAPDEHVPSRRTRRRAWMMCASSRPLRASMSGTGSRAIHGRR